jgi:hypothetical protein
VGSWYRVTKKINGRLYDYWQRTKRVGKSVKTENKYIGPAACAPSIAPSTYSITAAVIPEEAIYKLVPSTAQLNGKDKRDYEKYYEQIRREDEQIQYGNRADRIARQKAAVRSAKRKTKGIKASNPFLAQAIKKP